MFPEKKLPLPLEQRLLIGRIYCQLCEENGQDSSQKSFSPRAIPVEEIISTRLQKPLKKNDPATLKYIQFMLAILNDPENLSRIENRQPIYLVAKSYQEFFPEVDEKFKNLLSSI